MLVPHRGHAVNPVCSATLHDVFKHSVASSHSSDMAPGGLAVQTDQCMLRHSVQYLTHEADEGQSVLLTLKELQEYGDKQKGPCSLNARFHH